MTTVQLGRVYRRVDAAWCSCRWKAEQPTPIAGLWIFRRLVDSGLPCVHNRAPSPSFPQFPTSFAKYDSKRWWWYLRTPQVTLCGPPWLAAIIQDLQEQEARVEGDFQ